MLQRGVNGRSAAYNSLCTARQLCLPHVPLTGFGVRDCFACIIKHSEQVQLFTHARCSPQCITDCTRHVRAHQCCPRQCRALHMCACCRDWMRSAIHALKMGVRAVAKADADGNVATLCHEIRTSCRLQPSCTYIVRMFAIC